MALLSASERALLTGATPANYAVNLGQHLAHAGTLQCLSDFLGVDAAILATFVSRTVREG
jgi:hypothetical protein